MIKFISVRMDEEDKRVDKIKALRASRKKLSAQPRSGVRRRAAPAASGCRASRETAAATV